MVFLQVVNFFCIYLVLLLFFGMLCSIVAFPIGKRTFNPEDFKKYDKNNWEDESVEKYFR
jgi:hypothetical protein